MLNGFDGAARDAFNELSEALEKCREYMRNAYDELPARELEDGGEALLEKIGCVDDAIKNLEKVNYNMEDAGI